MNALLYEDDKDLTIEELLEKYPKLKEMSKYTLFITREEDKEIKDSETVVVNLKPTCVDGMKAYDPLPISVELLKRILTDDRYYDFTLMFFNSNIRNFRLGVIYFGEAQTSLFYTKNVIMQGIDKMVDEGKIEVNPLIKKRIDALRASASYDAYSQKCGDGVYNISIEGKDYSINIPDILQFFKLSPEELDSLLVNNELYGIPKKEFIYAAVKYFQETKALTDYVMPDDVVDNYIRISSGEVIDFQALNQYLVTKDTIHKKAHISDSLRDAILSEMPEDATTLEKAIYIYIKMCKLLTYDEEYYAVHEKGPTIEKHKDINYISTITPDNNQIVCFEFNLIYSILLDELGIHFESNYNGGKDYGNGHAYIRFRVDKFLLLADALNSVIAADIVRAKLNYPLVGISCWNSNKETQKEFSDAFNKMYNLVAWQDKSILKTQGVSKKPTFEEVLEEYMRLTRNVKEIGLYERFALLLDELESMGLTRIDAIGHIIQLRKVLFTEEQTYNNVSVTIIENNNHGDDRSAIPAIVIALNPSGFDNNIDNTTYYYLDSNNPLQSISKDELQKNFDMLYFKCHGVRDEIPGIKVNGLVNIHLNNQNIIK